MGRLLLPPQARWQGAGSGEEQTELELASDKEYWHHRQQFVHCASNADHTEYPLLVFDLIRFQDEVCIFPLGMSYARSHISQFLK